MIDVKKHKLADGHPLQFGKFRRVGSTCPVTSELHSIYELIGEHKCICGAANIEIKKDGE